MQQDIQLNINPHQTGLQTSNNRKMTNGRFVAAKRIQSIPIFKDIDSGELVGEKEAMKRNVDFAGYRYIYH